VPGCDQRLLADFEAARVATVLVFVAQDPVPQMNSLRFPIEAPR
jgi:hypothetical protein